MKAVIILALLMMNLCSFAQKAFEFEYYYGKTKNFEIKLSLANGFIMGSEIIKTDLTTNKRIKYFLKDLPEEKLQSITFLPDSMDRGVIRRKRDHIILFKMDDEYDILPQKIDGVIGLDLKTYRFRLYKQKSSH